MNSVFIAGIIVRRILRNKREFFALILLPIIIIGAMSYIIQQESNPPTIGIADNDGNIYSEQLLSHLERNFPANFRVTDKNKINKLVDTGRIDFGILINEDFTKLIQDNQDVKITLIFNSNPEIAQSIKEIINSYLITLYSADSLTKEIAPSPSASYETMLDLDKKEHQNFQNLSSTFGFVLIFIMIFIFTTIENIIEDKKNLTLTRIFALPVRGWEIITGNILGSLTVGIMQLVPLVLTLKYIFNIPWGASLVGLFLILFCFLVASIGIGVGISGLINKEFNITIIISTIIAPSTILGGAFIPATMLPEFINKLGYLVPQKWVMNAVEKIIIGNQVGTIFFDLLIILLFGLAFATFGLKTLKPIND